MRNDIIEYLEEEIRRRCESENNFWGMAVIIIFARWCKMHFSWQNSMERTWNYDEDKIEIVKNCIINHRGSELKDKNYLEEICVADADAISHFDSVPSLFHLAYSYL